MAERPLDFRIVRGSTRKDEISVHADPANIDALQKILRGWLEGNKWAKHLWPEFSAEVRVPGNAKLIHKVRP